MLYIDRIQVGTTTYHIIDSIARSSLSTKANISDIYTTTEINNFLEQKVNTNDLGDLATLNTISYTSELITNKPILGSLADQDTVNYETEVTNKPTLGTLAAKDKINYTTDINNLPTLGSLAAMNTISYTSDIITNKPTLGTLASKNDVTSDNKQYVRKNGAWSEISVSSLEWGAISGSLSNQEDLYNALSTKAEINNLGNLAFKDTVDYETEVTNKPTLGDLASLNTISYTSNYITNKPNLGELSKLDVISYTSDYLINKPALGELALKDKVNYTTDIDNLPTLGALAAKDSVNYSTEVTNKPTLGSLAALNAISYTSSYLTNKPTLGSLASKDTVDYSTEVTNKPTLGTLSSMNSISYTSDYITNKPTLGSLASKNSVSYSTEVTDKPTLGALSSLDSIDYTTNKLTNKPTLGNLAAKNTVDWDTDITDIPSTFPPESHNHDERYYTTTQVDTSLSTKAPLASPALTGTPTAPTAADGTNTTQIATTQFVQNAFKANDAMVFKGTIGSSGATVTSLPATHYQGWTYKVATAGSYAGTTCEIGDMIICITDGTSANNVHWTVIQANIDGTVTGPASATDTHIATFNGTSGKIIQDSGYTIGTSVPSNAVFTDTTYQAGNGLILSNTTFSASFTTATPSALGTANAGSSNNVARADHIHAKPSYGNINTSGAITATTTIANGDKIVIVDSSDSSKLTGSSITFDGSTTTKVLTQKGTWESLEEYALPTASSNTKGGIKIGNNLSMDGEVLNAVDTTYNNATSTTAGLLSASDKSKLDGIAEGANAYTLPTAASNTKGGVKVGDGLTISNEVLSNSGVRNVAESNNNGTIAFNINGTTTNINVKGLDSAAYTATTNYATSTHVHGNINNSGIVTTSTTIASGDSILITDNSDSSKIKKASITFDGSTATKALTQKGTWETFNNYSLPTAATDTKGGIKVGANLSMNGEILNAIDTTYENATTTAAGLMSSADKAKLDGIASGANAYSLPTASADTKGGIKIGSNLSMNGEVLNAIDTTYSQGSGITISDTVISNAGVRAIATGSSNGTISVNTNGTSTNIAVYGLGSAAYSATTDYATVNHIHDNATTTSNGFMSSTDKSKLDGIAEGANAYSLPTASSTVKGGIKIGSNLSIDDEVLNAIDTKYSQGTGIIISGTTINNAGVISISTGSTNGTINVNTNGVNTDIAVNGLGSAAYSSTTDFASIDHNHDERYYTTTEIDNFLITKIDNSDIYTTTEIDNFLTTKADKIELNNYVLKTGDVMSGNLGIKTLNADVTSVASTYTDKYFRIVDKNAQAFSLFGGAQLANGDVYNAITAMRKDQNNQDVQNYLYLITTSTGTRSIQIPNDSDLKASWCSQIGAVKKSGDTMTGTLRIRADSLADENNTPSSTIWGCGYYGIDKNGNINTVVSPVYYNDGRIASRFSTQRTIDGTMHYNSLVLGIRSDKTSYVAVDNPLIWRNGLGADSDGSWPISMGGTGSSTRITAVYNFFNDNVGTSTTHFLTFNYSSSKWQKVGYATIASVTTVLGLGSAAYIDTPISAANGGTGTTTLTLAGNAILNALETGSAGYHPAQDVYMLTQDSSKTKFVKRTIGDVFGSLNSTNITTALGYTPANDTDVAKLNVVNTFTKSQIISGQGLSYVTQNSSVVSGSTPPSDTTVGYVTYQDKSGNTMSFLRSVYYSNGNSALIFQTQRRKDSTTTSTYMNYIVFGNNDSGGAYVTLSSATAWRTALGLGTSGALPITVAQGGTNATSVAGARKNLGYLGMSFSDGYVSSEYTTISSNANLNTGTYLTTGKYICTSNTTVGTFTNCPTDKGFQMLVYDFIGGGGAIKSGTWQSRVRILMNYQGEIYTQAVERSGANAYTWGAWKKITTT